MDFSKEELNEILYGIKKMSDIIEKTRKPYKWIIDVADFLDQSNIRKDLSDKDKKFLNKLRKQIIARRQKEPLILSAMLFDDRVNILIVVTKNDLTTDILQKADVVIIDDKKRKKYNLKSIQTVKKAKKAFLIHILGNFVT